MKMTKMARKRVASVAKKKRSSRMIKKKRKRRLSLAKSL
jgi:hypothetical protein